MLRIALLVLVIVNCSGSSDVSSIATLRPTQSWDPNEDATLLQPTQFAAAGCSLYIYDRGLEKIVVLGGSSEQSSFGSTGSGPGEIRHLFAMSARSDGVVYAFDWIRGRLIHWSRDGDVLGDVPLSYHAPRHAFVGPMVALDDGTILDAPWGGRVSGTVVSAEAMDTAHLVYQIDSSGAVRQAWGRVPAAFDGQSGLARALFSSGDLAVVGDTLVYLRFAEPALEFFSLGSGGSEPVRRLVLTRLRKGLPATNQGHVEPGDSTESFRAPVLDPSASSLAAFGTDVLAVTLRHDDTPESERGPEEGPWAKEQLVVMKRDGTHVGTYELDGRETRSAAFLADGRYVRLYLADSTGGGGRVLGIYRIPGISLPAGSKEACAQD